MKILTEEEYGTLRFKEATRATKPLNPVRSALESIVTGQVLYIDKESWIPKSTPSSCINAWFTKKGSKKSFTMRSLANEEGWIVRRVR